MTKLFLLFIIFLFSLSLEAQVTLDIRMFIEGFYSAGNNEIMNNIGQGGCLYLNGISTNFNDVDTIQISIMDQLTYAEVESHKVILQTDGNVSSIFNSLILGNSYFIKINHRNTLETWSAIPIVISSLTSYDFTTSQSQAFGNNMAPTFDNLAWAFYSGDVNQDQKIDTTDYSLIETSVLYSDTGYILTDITGDGIVESLDYGLIINNSYHCFKTRSPLTIGIDETKQANIDFSIYPIPATKRVFIRFVKPKKINSISISILDLLGRIVLFEKSFGAEVEQKHELRLNSLMPGNYILILNDGSTNYVRKIIME